MGHEHHFLSRLDRVSAPEVELALELYRDHERVRFLLARQRLPEGAERVAISIDHPTNGPFLVVTREGRFVTCLGAGMKVDDLPIVTRAQLEGASATFADLRKSAEIVGGVAAEGQSRKLFTRLLRAGPYLARDELATPAAFHPFLGLEYLKSFVESVMRLEDMRCALRKVERPRKAAVPLLRAYWDAFWAMQHLAVLAFLDGPAVLELLPKGTLSEATVSWGLVRQGVITSALRGAWCAAKLGKASLSDYKIAYAEARTPLRLIETTLALGALGARHAKLRAEVLKTLSAPRVVDPNDGLDVRYGPLRAAYAELARQGLEEPDATAAALRDVGAQVTVRLCQRPNAPTRFAKPEDVPQGLAQRMIANHVSTILDVDAGIDTLLVAFPWVARAEPEDLYFSREELAIIQVPWEPDLTMHLLTQLREHYGKPQPKRAPGPARQGPCPCGSGKKYKRCCEGKPPATEDDGADR